MERKREGRYLIWVYRVQFPTGRVGQGYNCEGDACQTLPMTQLVDLIQAGIG